jgi:hypothetical protein
MSQHDIEVVVEGGLLSVYVSLEDQEIGLTRVGDTFTFEGTLEIDSALNLTFHAIGVPFTDWSIAITLDDADEPLFEDSGQLTLDGEIILKRAIPVPAPEGVASNLAAMARTSFSSTRKSSRRLRQRN